MVSAAEETVFFTRVVPSMVAIDRWGDRATVRIWTWPDGPDPAGGQAFPVASYAAARDLVPAGAIQVLNAPLGFADEVWLHPGE